MLRLLAHSQKTVVVSPPFSLSYSLSRSASDLTRRSGKEEVKRNESKETVERVERNERENRGEQGLTRSGERRGKSVTSTSLSTRVRTNERSAEEWRAGNREVRELARAGRVGEAAERFSALASAGPPPLPLWTSLLAGYGHQGNVRHTEKLWALLLSQGLTPSLRCHTARLSAYARGGDVVGALKALEQFHSQGLVPDTALWTTLLRAVGGSRQSGVVGAERVERMFGSLEQAALLRNVDTVTVTLLVAAAARRGAVEEALRWERRLPELSLPPTEAFYNALLLACASRPDYYEEGWAVLQRMEGSGFPPDIFTQSALLSMASRVGDVTRATALLQRMEAQKRGDRLAVTSLVAAFAFRIRRLMNPLKPSPNSQESANASTSQPAPEKVSDLVEKGLEVGRKGIEKYGVDVGLLNAMVSVLTVALRVNRSETFFREEFAAAQLSPDTHTLRHMLRLYAYTCRLESAEKLREEMEKDYGVSIDASHYRWLLLAATKSGNIPRAMQLLQEMLNKGFAPTEAMVKPLVQRCQSVDPKRVEVIKEMCGWSSFTKMFRVVRKPSEFQRNPQDEDE